MKEQKDPRFLIAGSFLSLSQLEEMIKTPEGQEEVQAAIDGARIFFATTHIIHILDGLGMTIAPKQKQKIFDVIATTCFNVEDEAILAAIGGIADDLEPILAQHKLENYDC